MFFVFHNITYKVCRDWNSQDISSFWDTQSTPSGTSNLSTANATKIIFLPHSGIWSQKHLNLLTMSACFYAFSCCHIFAWLNICTNKLMYLIQWSLRVSGPYTALSYHVENIWWACSTFCDCISTAAVSYSNWFSNGTERTAPDDSSIAIFIFIELLFNQEGQLRTHY